MKDFSGFDDYVPIFQGGKQTDSQGNEHDGDTLIDQAVAKFDPSYHEPPVVVGHPKDNSPAFGWVQSVKKVTQALKDGSTVNVLMAKFKDVVPEFAQAVQQGLYKKRSASFYPDGRLRHVGFLGGMPPAVKGLADLKFSEEDKAIEFEETVNFMVGSWGLSRVANILRGMRDFFIEKFDLATADKVIPSWDIDSIKEEADRMSQVDIPQTAEKPLFTEKEGDMPKTFTEEELQAQLKAERERLTAEFAEKETKIKAEAKKEAETSFSEKEKALTDRLTTMEKNFTEYKASAEKRERDTKLAAHEKEVDAMFAENLRGGRITPAQIKALRPLVLSLDFETPKEFGEGDAKVIQTAYEQYAVTLSTSPVVVKFSEHATRDKDFGGKENAGQQLTDLAEKKMRDNPKMDFREAFNVVQIENSDLAKEYALEIRGAH